MVKFPQLPRSCRKVHTMLDLAAGIRAFVRDDASRSILAIAGVVVAVGTVFYRFVEDLTWLDSFYFCVITLTTVGYGDISPSTPAGKLFTLGYVVVGIGVFVSLVSTMAHHLLEAKKS